MHFGLFIRVDFEIVFFLHKMLITLVIFFPAGQRILHHKSNVLETVVLINPSDEAVSTEVNRASC